MAKGDRHLYVWAHHLVRHRRDQTLLALQRHAALQIQRWRESRKNSADLIEDSRGHQSEQFTLLIFDITEFLVVF